jgi:Pyridoxamine 5'-phosphate oxidase
VDRSFTKVDYAYLVVTSYRAYIQDIDPQYGTDMIQEPATLSQFDHEKVISVETYRKNGEPVRTPVWFIKENGTLIVHTADTSGKAKRIRRNSKVRVAPSHFRGEPKGTILMPKPNW